MSRFPKMVFLWEAILKREGVEPTLALCAGYAIATHYAILKNHGARPNSKGESARSKKAQQKDLQAKVLEIPGRHPPFVKRLEYRLTRQGYEFFVAGKWVGQEKVAAFLRRFTDEELAALRSYAERLAKVMSEYGYANWFELWKAERDKEWAVRPAA